MREVDILVATARNCLPKGLDLCPWRIFVHADIHKGWAEASNRLLDVAEANGRDALFLDDDIEILPESFVLLEKHYHEAEVFGFNLMHPQGRRSYGWILPAPDRIMVDPSFCQDPCYVAHVTTSAIYLKHSVLKAGVRFPVWKGAWYEDVAFTIDCWLAGQRVAYIGGDIVHEFGTTKVTMPNGCELNDINLRALADFFHERDVVNRCSGNQVEAGKVPIGYITL